MTIPVNAAPALNQAGGWIRPYDRKLEIRPVPFGFDGQSELCFPLGGVDETRMAAWVEERIIAFVDTYLRLGGAAESRQPKFGPSLQTLRNDDSHPVLATVPAFR